MFIKDSDIQSSGMQVKVDGDINEKFKKKKNHWNVLWKYC